MLSAAKVATPATAVTVVVPARRPKPGLVPRAPVTVPVNAVATFPCASSAVTTTAGVIVAPATALVGCVVNTNFAAGPGLTLNAALVAPVTLAVAPPPPPPHPPPPH